MKPTLKSACYNSTMSKGEDYAYTFRMIVPGKSPEELECIRDDLADKSNDTSTPMVVSTMDDFMTISLRESTEFPEERLSYAVMLARTALDDYGVENPMLIRAHATRVNGYSLLEVHRLVVIESDQDGITDMTDVLLRDELDQHS